MAIETEDWEMYSGTDRTFTHAFYVDDVLTSTVGWDARLEIKINNLLATTPYIVKDTSNGAQAVGSGTNFLFYLVPSDFTTAPRYNFPYHWTIKVQSPAGKVYVSRTGKVKFLNPLTASVP
jgi:hypothetical protein